MWYKGKETMRGKSATTVFMFVSVGLMMLILSACRPIADSAIAAELEPAPSVVLTDAVSLNPFNPLGTDETIAGSRSILTRSDRGLDIVIDTVGLVPNEAHTLWWVVFNHPEHCATAGDCVGPDIENPDVATMVGFATGAVSDENGHARFVATLRVGDTSMATDNDSGFPMLLPEPSPGLIDPYTAIVHAVIRTHGAVMDNPYAQLTTFTADCNPDCANVQASAHLPAEK